MNQLSKKRLQNNEFEETGKHKSAFLIVHHTGKAKESRNPNKAQQLGSVGIEGKARQVLMLSVDRENPDIKIISIVKGNYLSETDKNKKIFLKFDPQTLLRRECEYETKKPLKSSIASSGDCSTKSKPGRKRDKELWARAIALYKEGKKQCEIAKELGVCAATISRWITKYKEATLYDTSKVGEVGQNGDDLSSPLE